MILIFLLLPRRWALVDRSVGATLQSRSLFPWSVCLSDSGRCCAFGVGNLVPNSPTGHDAKAHYKRGATGFPAGLSVRHEPAAASEVSPSIAVFYNHADCHSTLVCLLPMTLQHISIT